MGEKYWMVYREDNNGRTPVYKHWSEHEARAEAERLAQANRGVRFSVLAWIDSVIVPLPPAHWSRQPQTVNTFAVEESVF